MKRIADLIVKYRKIILIATIAILVLSSVGLFYFVYDSRINSDMLEYLPEDTSTAKGINFLKENFGIKGDAFVVVEGEKNDPELYESVERLKNIDGMSQFFWVGDVENLENITDLLSSPIFSNVEVDTNSLKKYLKEPINPDSENSKYNYVLLMLFDYSPSTEEAYNVLDTVKEEFSDRNMAVSGMTAMAKQVMEETMAELVYYIVFSVLIVLVILFLSTSSYIEPLILMATLLISVLINMGTNIIYPSVSIISFAASGVLQLGIAMDYAIFFMHTYKEERFKDSAINATKRSIPKVSITIFASALTTIGGFAALCFMDFQIGIDLAKVIVKGIFLSFLTVLLLQPTLVIFSDRLLQKTRHKELNLNFNMIPKFTVKWRKVIIIIVLLLIAPAYFGQKAVPFSYLKIYEEPETVNSQQEKATKLGNQIISAVPLETKTGGHEDYINELKKDEKISNIIGAYTVLKMDEEKLGNFLNIFLKDGKPASEELQALGTLFKKIDGKWYTLYMIEIDGDTENKEAFETHKHLIDTTNKYFSENYPLGILTGVNDMAKVTPRDFLRVTLISAGIILLIMSLLLKSFRKSICMVLLIELAIWINISLNFVFGSSINFMVYIIISSVQLGCTVDYAILLSTRFEEAKREYKDVKKAAAKAATSAFPAITMSASIIICCCLAIVFVSNNLLVREMAWILARGAFISYVLVITVLPCLLVYFKKIRPIKEEVDSLINHAKKKNK